MKLPTQIHVCGRRPPVLGALIDVMEKHARPFVLQMAQENRHELVSAIQLLANNLKMTPIILNAANTSEITQYLLEKERNLIVIIESETQRISLGMQSMILERYEPSINSSEIRQLLAQGMPQENIRSHLPKRNPPAGLLIVTDTDPGELCQAGYWSRDFTGLKHFTLRWDNLPQRPDAYQALFKAWLMVSAKEFGIELDEVLDPAAVTRYAWMQKILASHAKNARRRGMTLQAHQTVEEVMLAAHDCVLYVSNGKNRHVSNGKKRRIDVTVIEALIFMGVTQESLALTFGLEPPKRKRRSDDSESIA